jgi:hypothetical protein
MDNSVTEFNSFVLALTLGKRHIADANQNIAEPHAVIIAPVSMYGLISILVGSGMDAHYSANPIDHMVISIIGPQ